MAKKKRGLSDGQAAGCKSRNCEALKHFLSRPERTYRAEPDMVPDYVSVDAVVVVNSLRVVLVERGNEPHKGKLAFPGGRLMVTDRNLRTAASRELEEETGLILPPEDFDDLMTLSDGGDTRPQHRTSAVFVAEISGQAAADIRPGDDAARVMLNYISGLRPEDMAFEHWRIVERLRSLCGTSTFDGICPICGRTVKVREEDLFMPNSLVGTGQVVYMARTEDRCHPPHLPYVPAGRIPFVVRCRLRRMWARG